MRITEIRIGCSKTINLGDFNSLRIEASVTVEVGEEDIASFEVMKREAQLELRRLLQETYTAQKRGAA